MQKHTALIVFLLILSTPVLSAQGVSRYADSLKQRLAFVEPPVERIHLFTAIAQEYVYWEDYDNGKHFAYQAIAVAEKEGTPPSTLEAPLLILASALYEKSNLDSLHLILSKLSELCTASGNINCLIEYYNTQATLFDLSTHPDSSIYFYQKALALAEGDPYWEDLILSNIGVVFASLKLHERARDYYLRAYKLALKAEDDYIQGLTLLNVAYTFIEENQLDSADYYLTYAHEAAINSKYTDVLAGVHCYMGLSQLQRKNLTEADSLLHMAMDTYTLLGQEFEIAETLPYLADLYYEQGSYEKAKSAALKAIEINQHTESKVYLLNAYQTLAKLHRTTKAYQLADRYMQAHNKLQESIQKQTLLNQFSTLEMDYQLAKKEAQLQLINTQRTHERRIQKYIAAGTIGLLFLLGTIIYLLFHQSKRRREQNEWLEAQVKQRTAELNSSNEELKNSLEEIKSFTHITSHDLKEPLRNISSFTSLIERRLKTKLDSETVVFMNHIKDNTQRMYRLIEDILYYATLDAKEYKKFTHKNVDLNQLIANIKVILATTIQEKNAVIHISDDLPNIQSSPEALQVIVKNLIENGIKYNRSSLPKIEISYTRYPHEHHLFIQDNGIGIETQYQQQVFQMFKRLHNQQEFEGTGMGLAICRKLMRRLGGNIQLQSDEGKGCIFTVIIPLVNAQKQTKAPQKMMGILG